MTSLKETKKTVDKEKKNNKTENPGSEKGHVRELHFKGHIPTTNSTQTSTILLR